MPKVISQVIGAGGGGGGGGGGVSNDPTLGGATPSETVAPSQEAVQEFVGLAPFTVADVAIDVSGGSDTVTATAGAHHLCTLGSNVLTLPFPSAAANAGKWIAVTVVSSATTGASVGYIIINVDVTTGFYTGTIAYRSNGTEWVQMYRNRTQPRGILPLFEPRPEANYPTGGDICTAAELQTYQTFRIQQTTEGQTLTFPTPATLFKDGTTRRVTCTGAMTASAVMYGVTLYAKKCVDFNYIGGVWLPQGDMENHAALTSGKIMAPNTGKVYRYASTSALASAPLFKSGHVAGDEWLVQDVSGNSGSVTKTLGGNGSTITDGVASGTDFTFVENNIRTVRFTSGGGTTIYASRA